MVDLLHDPELHQRKTVRTVEISDNGGRRVVDLDELNKADAELAGKFGYNPVLKRVKISSLHFASPTDGG